MASYQRHDHCPVGRLNTAELLNDTSSTTTSGINMKTATAASSAALAARATTVTGLHSALPAPCARACRRRVSNVLLTTMSTAISNSTTAIVEPDCRSRMNR